jgi:predicted nuclease of predicted toxin-antitoxin system
VAIRFYCDEDVHILVAVIGRQAGLDITHTQEYGRKGAKDPDQLAFAAKEERVLVTVNCADFEPITVYFMREGSPHTGVLCIPSRVLKKVSEDRQSARTAVRFRQHDSEVADARGAGTPGGDAAGCGRG